MEDKWKKGYILTMGYERTENDEDDYEYMEHSFVIFNYMLKHYDNSIEKHIKECFPNGTVKYIDEIEYRIDYDTSKEDGCGGRYCDIEIKGYEDIKNIDINCGWIGECSYDTEKRMFIHI